MATTLSIDGPSAILPTTPYTPALEIIDVPGLKMAKAALPSPLEPVVVDKPDIEHVYVQDDPRKWSPARKAVILAIIASASLIQGLATNIYNPGIELIKSELHATSGQISLSLALFILIQGIVPLLWSVISEIKGRKIVYITSITIAVVGCIVAALAKTIQVLIGMRCLQAVGSSAVMAIGAATLADIYDQAERGTMMGIYYAAPLLGPSLGPILGGVLTQFLSWRATFWFLAIFMGCCLVAFLFFFRDTFRMERSLLYQTVLKSVKEHQHEKELIASRRSSMATLRSGKSTPAPDLEAAEEQKEKEVVTAPAAPAPEVKLSLKDVNPLPPVVLILRRWNNLAILSASGFLSGFGNCISYTCVLTLEVKYNYDALKTGLVLLSYGVGCIFGSILGGRWSDHVLKKLRAQGGHTIAETRLQSTKAAMLFLPLSVIAYAWLAEKRTHIASICVALFFSGFFNIWIYSSTLSYIVDANVGRSSSAVAANSCLRGLFAFTFAEVAVPLQVRNPLLPFPFPLLSSLSLPPLTRASIARARPASTQNKIGDGGLYSLWTGLLIICELLILLVLYKGGRWREQAEAREARNS